MSDDPLKRLRQLVDDQNLGIYEIEKTLDSLRVGRDEPLRQSLGRLAMECLRINGEVAKLKSARPVEAPTFMRELSEIDDPPARKPDFLSFAQSVVESKTPRPSARRSHRDQVIDLLSFVDRPVTPTTLQQLSVVMNREILAPTRFASLRRDERQAYDRAPTKNHEWIVPALSVHDFSARSRVVCSSRWSLELRMIGPETLRLNHLRLALKLVNLISGSERDGHSRELEALILRLCSVQHLPVGDALNLAKVCVLVTQDLDQHEEFDLEQRRSAAHAFERSHRSPSELIWGAPMSPHKFSKMED